MAKIVIDGRSFSGSNITIRNGKLMVDGVQQDGTLQGVVEVRVVEGTVDNLQCDMDIHCGDVRGNVRAGMSVTCKNVGGDVKSGMSVDCGEVGGNIDAGMGVTYAGRKR